MKKQHCCVLPTSSFWKIHIFFVLRIPIIHVCNGYLPISSVLCRLHKVHLSNCRSQQNQSYCTTHNNNAWYNIFDCATVANWFSVQYLENRFIYILDLQMGVPLLGVSPIFQVGTSGSPPPHTQFKHCNYYYTQFGIIHAINHFRFNCSYLHQM